MDPVENPEGTIHRTAIETATVRTRDYATRRRSGSLRIALKASRTMSVVPASGPTWVRTSFSAWRQAVSRKPRLRNAWNASVWARNLTDEAYAGFTPETLPLSGMDAYFLAPPRTYGATLRYDF